ncbi:MAG: HAD family hydrolase [Candidatus Caldarchaeum sp.]
MIIAVDVDGTLDVGDPPGPVSVLSLANIVKKHVPSVVIVSDSYEKVWNRVDLLGYIIPVCAITGGKAARLKAIRNEYPAEGRYILVGNSPDDAEAAREAGYEYMTPQQFKQLIESGLL